MADDMGYSDLGSYGGEIQTPNLDALAEGGLRFTHFYNTGRCVPTRGSLLTGVYPHQAGIGHMVGDRDEPGYRGRLVDRVVTVAEVLGEAGYQTFLSGKWHVTHYNYNRPNDVLHASSWPLERGFDRFYGFISGGGGYYDMVSLAKDDQFVDSEPRLKDREQFYLTDEINDHAAHFIREAERDKPFFLYVAHYAPHWPLHAFEEDIAKYEGVYDVGWDQIRQDRYERMLEMGIVDDIVPLSERHPSVPAWEDAENKEWEARRMAVHAAMVDRMDQGLGDMIDALKETGQFDNTIILFVSDNGASSEVIQGVNTRHGRFERGGTTPDIMPGPPDTYASFGPQWANASNTPLRLFKKWNHEGGVAAPLIAHWPDGITEAGGLRHEPGHVIDFMATAVDLANAEYPTTYQGHEILPMEGRSLVPVFAGNSLDQRPIYFEHEGNRAVRLGDWKLVQERGERWNLYDMSVDRTETNDLSETHTDKVEWLELLWNEWARRAYVR
ncbi:MAG: arylsulfatase [Phycisphaeraceae bacterium]